MTTASTEVRILKMCVHVSFKIVSHINMPPSPESYPPTPHFGNLSLIVIMIGQ
jgi:hypothetical protein